MNRIVNVLFAAIAYRRATRKIILIRGSIFTGHYGRCAIAPMYPNGVAVCFGIAGIGKIVKYYTVSSTRNILNAKIASYLMGSYGNKREK